jgi:hypothetical protein
MGIKACTKKYANVKCLTIVCVCVCVHAQSDCWWTTYASCCSQKLVCRLSIESIKPYDISTNTIFIANIIWYHWHCGSNDTNYCLSSKEAWNLFVSFVCLLCWNLQNLGASCYVLDTLLESPLVVMCRGPPRWFHNV